MTVESEYRVSSSNAALKPTRLVLVGSSGQVGALLARHFQTPGSEVCVVARTTFSAPWRVVAWDAAHLGPWTDHLEGADVVINLPELYGRGGELVFGVSASEWMLDWGAFFIRAETELTLKSRRVVPGRLLKQGFRLDFPDWSGAALDLVENWRSRKQRRTKT
jgi:NAD dependent epimerase/dehydratase family enzyme